jgi:hypothetical protein
MNRLTMNVNLLELKTHQNDWEKTKKKFEKNLFLGGGGNILISPYKSFNLK